MSLRLIRVLLHMDLQVDYTGVDPYQAQLDIFRNSVQPGPILTLRTFKGSVTSYVPDQEYDLVFASHMLYYVDDWGVFSSKSSRQVERSSSSIMAHAASTPSTNVSAIMSIQAPTSSQPTTKSPKLSTFSLSKENGSSTTASQALWPSVLATSQAHTRATTS